MKLKDKIAHLQQHRHEIKATYDNYQACVIFLEGEIRRMRCHQVICLSLGIENQRLDRAEVI
jgi:hypothetical protein